MSDKTYLGDGVYADYNGYHVILSTQDIIAIYLDDTVAMALVDYIKRTFGYEESQHEEMQEV